MTHDTPADDMCSMEVDSGEFNVDDEEITQLSSNLSLLTLEGDADQGSPAKKSQSSKSRKRATKLATRSQTSTIVRQEVTASRGEITAISILVFSNYYLAESKSGLIPFTVSTCVLLRSLAMHFHTLLLYHFSAGPHNRLSRERVKPPASEVVRGKMPSKHKIRLATVRGRSGKRAAIIAAMSTIRAAILIMVLALVVRGLKGQQGFTVLWRAAYERWSVRLVYLWERMPNKWRGGLRFFL